MSEACHASGRRYHFASSLRFDDAMHGICVQPCIIYLHHFTLPFVLHGSDCDTAYRYIYTTSLQGLDQRDACAFLTAKMIGLPILIAGLVCVANGFESTPRPQARVHLATFVCSWI